MSLAAQPMVVVVGSVNQDIVLTVPAMPVAGQTVLATSGFTSAGGKGANQAVAAARAGAATKFVGSFGAGAEAAELRRQLEAGGVEVVAHQSDLDSGRAVVLVDPQGENSIIVDQGANGDLPVRFIEEQLKDLGAHDVLVVQCELAHEAIEKALTVGMSRKATVILNLAPYRRFSTLTLRSADVIVVNESEAAELVEKQSPLKDPISAASEVSRQYGCACVITLAEKGSVVASEGLAFVVPAVPVSNVVDTTGAGDSFVGTLAAALLGGASLERSVGSAATAAADTVVSLGAQGSSRNASTNEMAPGPVT